MPDHRNHRLVRPETLTAIGLIAVSAGLLIPAAGLRPISALLPAAMLIGLLILAAIMLVKDQRKAAAGEAAQPMTKAPGRVLGAFGLIVLHAVAVDLIGFYPSTALSVPLVARVFGYRHPLGLAIATLIVLASIWLIFGLAMSRDFPTGRFWSL
ncbi:tripartite tricarboxylate transporter TctB family protein [Salipiger sp.]|uniref:tripartite tricarboxylate transporter TctB family protein n=1 Tax=Salipiger sp. TaxID=2078585 RepID=UPI003A974C2D